MDAFVRPLYELNSFEELEHFAEKPGTVISASGCMDAQKPHMMYGLNNGRGTRVIVTFNEQNCWRHTATLNRRQCIFRQRIFCSISRISVAMR